jgi:hypothetical protein
MRNGGRHWIGFLVKAPAMIDTDFERNSRAHSFWEEWQSAADKAGNLDTYLDNLIAKASPQWQGVDVDEFMDTVRGRESDNTQRREGDEMSDYIASINPDWVFVVDTLPPSNHSGDLIVDFTVSKNEFPFKKYHPRTDIIGNPL